MLDMLSSDTTRDFLIEYVNEMSKFDTESYRHMKGTVLTEKVFDFPGIKDSVNCQGIINRSLTDLTKMIETGDIVGLSAFFLRIRNNVVDEHNETVIIVPNLNEVDKIRPQFLPAYVDNIRNTIIMFLKGTVDKDRVKQMVSNEVFEQTKRQICKTTIDTSYDLNDVAKTMSGENVAVTPAYITANIIPFLKNLASDYKTLARDAALTIDAINDASQKMSDTIQAYNDMNIDHKVDNKLSLILYKAVRNFIALRSYTAFLMTRKILIYSNTLLEYENLYNILYWRHPEGERVLHESVLDGDLGKDVEDFDIYNDIVNGEGNLMAVRIRSTVDRRSTDIANFSNRTIGYNILNVADSNGKYDKNSYQTMVEIFESFTSRINDFVNAIMAGDIFDDAQNHTGFDQTLSVKYSSIINKFSEVAATDFTANSDLAIDQIVSAYSEINDMEDNTLRIKDAIRKAKQSFDEDVRTLNDAKTNQNEISGAVLDEACAFMEEVEKQFKELVVDVCKAIYNRLINLDDSISIIMDAKDNSSIIVSEATDNPFDVDSILNEMAIEEAQQRALEVFRECVKDYRKSRAYEYERVNVVFEADTVAADTASNTQPAQGTTGDNANGGKTLGQRLKDIGHAIMNFFRQLFGRVQKDADKAMGNNSGWFAKYEEAVRNADVSSLSVRMLPYDDKMVGQSVTDLENIKNKIINMNEDELKKLAKDKDAIRNLVYGGIIKFKDVQTGKSNRKKKNAEGFNAVVRQYYAIGTNARSDETPLSPEVLKAKIPTMIDYCKGYKTTVDEWSVKCTAAGKAIDAKLAKIAGDGANKTTTESTHGININKFIFEADAKVNDTSAGDNTSSSNHQQTSQPAAASNNGGNDNKVSNKATVEVRADAKANVGEDQDAKFAPSDGYQAANAVSKDFMTFGSSVATSYRDRYIAYMDVLKKIVGALNIEGDAVQNESTNPKNNNDKDGSLYDRFMQQHVRGSKSGKNNKNS